MYGIETYVALGMITFFCIIIANIVYNCFILPVISYIKGQFASRKDKAIDEMTIAEVNAMIEQLSFETMVKDVCNGETPIDSLTAQNNPLKVLAPCEFHNCPQHVTRTDCCASSVIIGDKIYCRQLVDPESLKNLGIDRSDGNTYILTKEEVKQFTDSYLKWVSMLRKFGE